MLIESIIAPAPTDALFYILGVCATATADINMNTYTPWGRTRETDLSCHGVGGSAALLLQHSLHQLHTLQHKQISSYHAEGFHAG